MLELLKTLRIDSWLENVFIVLHTFHDKTVKVSLNEGVYPQAINKLAQHIHIELRAIMCQRQKLTALKSYTMNLAKKMPYQKPDNLLTIIELKSYKFHFNDLYVGRDDVISKTMPR